MKIENLIHGYPRSDLDRLCHRDPGIGLRAGRFVKLSIRNSLHLTRQNGIPIETINLARQVQFYYHIGGSDKNFFDGCLAWSGRSDKDWRTSLSS